MSQPSNPYDNKMGTYKDSIELAEFRKRQRAKTRKEYLDSLIWNKFSKDEIVFLLAEFDRVHKIC